MTESRMELLNWLNSTLNLNYTKVEQLGTGAAYCQLIDSIFLDVPMHKVKFEASKEYEYINNYKVLQSTFVKHKIQKSIPVDKLVKCKFQDNLEFFQWIRKYWKENKDESEYDPDQRRTYVPPPGGASNGTTAAPRLSRTTNVSSSTTATARRSASASSTNSMSTSTLPRSRISSNNSRSNTRVSSLSNNATKELEAELSQAKNTLADVEEELMEYKNAVGALETERNFYFNKLREIEILTEGTSDLLKDENAEHPSLKDILIKIQEVLYSTEEGFQVPDEEEEIVNDINMEEETF